MFKGNSHSIWPLLTSVDLVWTQVTITKRVINFSVQTYEDMNQNCLQGDTWSFDSTFLFVGSVATTIGNRVYSINRTVPIEHTNEGYGNITPKTENGKVICMLFTGKYNLLTFPSWKS